MKFMQKKKIWFLISALLLLPGIISLFVWQLRLGIDFKGGSSSEYRQTVQNTPLTEAAKKGSEQIKTVYKAVEIPEPNIQTDIQTNEVRFYVKSQTLTEEKHDEIVRRLSEENPKFEELTYETIDPQIGRDVTQKAIYSVVFASIAIIIYIALSFRGVPRPTSSWQFGIIAVIALLHDVLFIVGFYSLMGHFAGYEVKAEFVTAALTVMGFSVHDTIVVFDRLRENLKRFPSHSFTQVANMSVAQTFTRSLNTSLTVILVLLAIVLLGGQSIREFTLTLLVGIAVGTYSSIFFATPLLDWWQHVSPKVKQTLHKLRKKTAQRTKRALSKVKFRSPRNPRTAKA